MEFAKKSDEIEFEEATDLGIEEAMEKERVVLGSLKSLDGLDGLGADPTSLQGSSFPPSVRHGDDKPLLLPPRSHSLQQTWREDSSSSSSDGMEI